MAEHHFSSEAEPMRFYDSFSHQMIPIQPDFNKSPKLGVEQSSDIHLMGTCDNDGDAILPCGSTEYREEPSCCYEENGSFINLLLQEVTKDVLTACRVLKIPKDPRTWNTKHVEKWLKWTLEQYSHPVTNLASFRMSGASLCALSEQEIIARNNLSGNIIRAQLEIWRTVAEDIDKKSYYQQSLRDRSFHSEHWQSLYRAPSDRSLASSGSEMSEDEQSNPPSPSGQLQVSHTFMTPDHPSGIQLWQFLKQLLKQQEKYSHCIRWMDKKSGIFKIEDSVEVAKLWGIRKNRPAMNYDKLSRSLRQYYKKKILKKTTVSQRLVYQFVQP